MQKIQFHTQDRNPILKKRKKLKLFLENLFAKEDKKLGKLGYIFCSDKYLLGINQDFLNHDYYTDVITFDLSATTQEIEGEVYLSIDRIKDNARILNVPFGEELHRIIIHGALHLCGYRDKTKKDAEKMRYKEDEYLKALL